MNESAREREMGRVNEGSRERTRERKANMSLETHKTSIITDRTQASYRT